jgi:hypothetical protein
MDDPAKCWLANSKPAALGSTNEILAFVLIAAPERDFQFMGLEDDAAHRSIHNLRNFRNRVSLRQLFKSRISSSVQRLPIDLLHYNTGSEVGKKRKVPIPSAPRILCPGSAAPARLAMQPGPPHRMAMAVARGFCQVTATRFDCSELVRSTPPSGTSGNDPR